MRNLGRVIVGGPRIMETMRPPNILYMLLPLLTLTGALEVTMRTPDVSVLRGEDVSIPCQIRDLNSGSAISILWSRKSEDGTHHDVYEYNNGDGKAHRPGSSMKLTEVLNGNAELHLPRVQFSDEGQYFCTVINTPNKADGKATLQVSAPPSADVTPESPTIEDGAEKTMMCKVYNFYPKDISIRWGQCRKGSSDCEILEIWTCVKKLLNNSDGTYNVTSLLTLTPKMEDNGKIYSCIISHRSLLRTELSRNLTLTVTERQNNTIAVITAMLLTILGVLLLGVFSFLYFRFMKKDPPTLSEITGNDHLIDMNRTTLTCQIMDFRPNDIEISVCMRRSGEEEEMRTIYTWRSEGLPTLVRISKDGGGGDEEVVDMEEGIQLMNGSAGHEDGPLQLEMTPLIRMKKFGAFLCHCSLQITPSYDLDNGAELSVRVKHPALTTPVSVLRTLNVIGVPPKLLSIMSPDRVTHEERLTLTCPINGFKPRDLSITWLRREKNNRETELVTWNPGKKSIHREKYSHRVKENEHKDDYSFSYVSALTMKPTIREDDGVTYICRTFHPATDHWEEREQILSVTAVPVLDPILKGQDNVNVGEKLDLSCRIHSFYPSDIQVTWYTGDDIITSSQTTEPLPDNDGLYHVTSTSRYTPTMRDLGKKFRCQVQHDSLWNPKPVAWILGELFSPPTLGDIQCDPAQPELGKSVTVSCAIDNMYPGDPTIQWYRGLTKLKPEEWKDKIQKGSESEIFSGTTELTLIPTSEHHGTSIRLEITHKGKTFTKEYPLLLKGFYKLSEISSDPKNPDYGRPLTLRCDVIDCNPADTPEVTWSGNGRDLEKRVQRVTRGSGDVLSCSLTITPTARDYGKVYSCRVTHKGMKNYTEKKIHLMLPERPPTLSDIVVHPTTVTANQEASFTVTISGYSPRDLHIKWYKEFCTFPQSEVTISDPEMGLDGLYKSSSTLTFTPKMSDDNTTLRCEVTHSQSKSNREKRYTLHLIGESMKPEAPISGLKKKFQIREIKCVTERPRVGEEVTLVAHIEECQADRAEFTWSSGMFAIDEEMENRQDGPDCTSTITFTPKDSDTDCPIKLEVFYNYQTVEEFFTLPLV